MTYLERDLRPEPAEPEPIKKGPGSATPWAYIIVFVGGRNSARYVNGNKCVGRATNYPSGEDSTTHSAHCYRRINKYTNLPAFVAAE